MSELLLVIGRTSKQGVGTNAGKETAEFVEATTYMELTATDAARAGVEAGETVELISPFGQTRVVCRIKPDQDLQPGLAFMAYGPTSSLLMGEDTHGTGMPDSKLLTVRMKRAE